MLDLEQVLRDRDLPARMILQVHDELVLELDEAVLVETAHVVRDTMENAFTLDVPTVVETRTGPNWEDMQALEISG
jgi:DNA polymerase-1